MPRPNGLAEAEMNRRIKALGERVRAQQARPGYDPTVRVTHVPPQPRRTAKQRKTAARYPGWKPEEKTCPCGKPFVPSTPLQRYHTQACQLQAERQHRRSTDAEKRDRRKAALEAQLGEPVSHRGNPLKRTCGLAGCDVEFIPKHHRERYCCPEHRTEAKRKLKRDHARRARGVLAPPAHPTSATREAMAAIEGLAPPTEMSYLVMLWRRVNEDPDCPPETYDRLEQLLGLRPDLDPGKG